MIDEEDQKDIIQAAVNNLMRETTKLGEASKALGETLQKEDMSAFEMMEGLVTVLAINTNTTVALGTVLMAHLHATGMLKPEVKLHS